jgi:hypothetical protein
MYIVPRGTDGLTDGLKEKIMDKFELFWELFPLEPEFANRRAACWLEWNKRSALTQDAMIAFLQKGGKPRTRNPYFFIVDFKDRSALGQPVNYKGRLIPSGVQVFSAKYNGAWGMYTQADILKFHMELPSE